MLMLHNDDNLSHQKLNRGSLVRNMQRSAELPTNSELIMSSASQPDFNFLLTHFSLFFSFEK